MTRPPRALLFAAGTLTLLVGAGCLVLAMVSLPVVQEMQTGMTGLVASVVASVAAITCGVLVWRGRLIPLALAAGLDIGFGVGLPRPTSALGATLRMLADDAEMANVLITAAAVVMFVAAVMCVFALPSALRLRDWVQSGGPMQTLPGFVPGPQHVSSEFLTAQRPRRYIPVMILAGAVTTLAIIVAIIGAASGPEPAVAQTITDARQEGGSAAAPAVMVVEPIEVEKPAPDAAPPPDAPLAPEQPLSELVAAFHVALTSGERAQLEALFDASSFAFGVDAKDVAIGPKAIAKQLRADIGKKPNLEVGFSHEASDGVVGWIAEEVVVGDKPFVVTLVAGYRTRWTIGALHWAQALPNTTAYKLARDGDLAEPEAIPDGHDDAELAAAMHSAFASRSSFIAAISDRDDAFNFGSAPSERVTGGDAIKKLFERMTATIRARDAIQVGMIGDGAGWGVANVDFTDGDRNGTQVTQTFRVLAAWIKIDGRWRIVQTQWSNAR